MTKSELKTGMLIELRDGSSAIIFLNTPNGDIYASPASWMKRTWGLLSNFNENLTFENEKDPDHRFADIMRVFSVPENLWFLDKFHRKVIFERIEDSTKHLLNKHEQLEDDGAYAD